MNLISLCDEVLQLIIYELNDPSNLSLSCKRFYNLTQDPYVRAHYFLARYGATQAIYHALGRGRLLNSRVLDILISSGAHLSRYLIQVASHHYFHTTSHFIKTPWVRTVPLSVFTYFLQLASEKYDLIPRGKGDDDGSIFLTFIKERRIASQSRHIEWETIRDILEKYHFIPFSSKDPIMVQFPLALALEPRLLPYAVANGFYMDSKYRDFVFRKIFEKPASPDRGVDDIVQNVRELCRLDKTMFVSRTVAAEVCMEAKANDIGYAALKRLDKSGDLLFDLANVVEDLLKLFLTSRSSHNSHTLRQLYADFPSNDPAVRIVLLMTVFTNPEGGHVSSGSVKSRLESLKLGPVTRVDICNLFINPYLERFNVLLEYLRTEIPYGEDGQKGMNPDQIRAVVEDVAVRCLELECKGKMLRKLHEGYPTVRQAIVQTVLNKHRINLEDLPPSDDINACTSYRPKLCRTYFPKPREDSDYFWEGEGNTGDTCPEDNRMVVDSDGEEDDSNLGHIGQESLTTMIRQDELMPVRARRRSIWSMGSYMQSLSTSQLPYDSLPVGKWIKDEFGAESSVTSVFMTHAILNNHGSILRYYLSDHNNVPITLKHFELLAHLGKAPNFFLYSNIQAGAKFYRDEDEYISSTDNARALLNKIKVKTEAVPPVIPPPSEPEPILTDSPPPSPSTSRKRKRPRRSAATVAPSYVIPDSDDEAIAVEDDYDYDEYHEKKRKKKLDHSQLWLKHLGDLLRVEQAKHRAKKKQLESEADPDTKLRVPKSEFLKSLSTNLRNLRKHDEARRMVYNAESCDDYSDSSDDDYARKTRNKRRKYQRG